MPWYRVKIQQPTCWPEFPWPIVPDDLADWYPVPTMKMHLVAIQTRLARMRRDANGAYRKQQDLQDRRRIEQQKSKRREKVSYGLRQKGKRPSRQKRKSRSKS